MWHLIGLHCRTGDRMRTYEVDRKTSTKYEKIGITGDDATVDGWTTFGRRNRTYLTRGATFTGLSCRRATSLDVDMPTNKRLMPANS